MIKPGDKFELYADNCASGSMYWQPTSSQTPYGAFSIGLGQKCGWAIIDRKSGGVITSGSLII